MEGKRIVNWIILRVCGKTFRYWLSQVNGEKDDRKREREWAGKSEKNRVPRKKENLKMAASVYNGITSSALVINFFNFLIAFNAAFAVAVICSPLTTAKTKKYRKTWNEIVYKMDWTDNIRHLT